MPSLGLQRLLLVNCFLGTICGWVTVFSVLWLLVVLGSDGRRYSSVITRVLNESIK